MVRALISHRHQIRRGFLRLSLAQSCVVFLMICLGPILNSSAQELGGMPRLSMPDKTPDDNLERMEVSVAVDQAIARLNFEARANLSESNTRWLNIPLGLGSVQVVPTQRSEGDVAEFPSIRISADGSGYVWRLAPGDQGHRDLQFAAACNLRVSPQGQSLRLDLPLVPTIVRIELPIGQWELSVIGNGMEVIEPFQNTESHSITIVHVSGGSTTFTWSKKSGADQVQAIEVESQTKYMPLMETGEFRAIANLAIRGSKTLGGRRFLITLPDRSQWREPMTSPISYPGYRFGRAEMAAANSNTVLVLEFEESFSRTEIELPVEWHTSNLPETNSISFSMLRVEGIQRHVGNVDLAVPRNVSLQWEPQAGIQFVRQSQSSDGSDTLNYNFRFSQQSEPLIVHWNVGDLADDLKAAYNIVYDSSALRLSGNIDILGDVRLLPFLKLDVRGWTVDRVQLQPSGRELDLNAIRSRSTVDSDGTQQEATSIPLSLGELLDPIPKNGIGAGNRPQPDGQSVPKDGNSHSPLPSSREEIARPNARSISFVLSRTSGLAEESEISAREFGFSLPMLSWLDADSQQWLSVCVGGEMTIQSTISRLRPFERMSPSVKPVPDVFWKQDEQMIGSQSTQTGSRSLSQRSVLKYRVVPSKFWVDWKGISETIGIVIRAKANTRVALTDNGLDILQSWSLVSVAGTAKTLRIGVPKEWLPLLNSSNDPSDSIQLSVDNIPVAADPMHGSLSGQFRPFVSPSFEQRYGWILLNLPSAQAGTKGSSERKLTIQHRINHRDKLQRTPSSFDWPLPWIAADRPNDSISIEEFAGEIVYDNNLHCDLQSPLGGVESVIPAQGSSALAIPFDRTLSEPRLFGGLSLKSDVKEKDYDIESVWLQTIVNAVEQRDRIVFRFKTSANSISLSLPAGRIANGEFLVNGRKAIPNRNPADVNSVDLPLDTSEPNTVGVPDKAYVLEVFLWTSNKTQWLKTLQAELPSIVNCRTRAPLVWQIVVPTTVHLIGNTTTLSPGYHWKWKDLWFERKSDWTQDHIGEKMGATSLPFVSQQTNEYVFFSLDHTVGMRVWTAPRYVLWAPVALFVLIGSYFVLEFKWIRKPSIGILILLSSVAFSQWAWDLSIALVQCFVAAIGIAILYSTLKWVVDRRSRRRSVFAARHTSPMVPHAARSPSLSGLISLPKPVISGPLVNGVSQEIPPLTTTTAEADGGK